MDNNKNQPFKPENIEELSAILYEFDDHVGMIEEMVGDCLQHTMVYDVDVLRNMMKYHTKLKELRLWYNAIERGLTRLSCEEA